MLILGREIVYQKKQKDVMCADNLRNRIAKIELNNKKMWQPAEGDRCQVFLAEKEWIV